MNATINKRTGTWAGNAKVPQNLRMNKRRGAILAFIRNYQNEHGGMPPNLREIGEAVGLSSSSTVQLNCQVLVALGEIQQSASKARGYHIPAERRDEVGELELCIIRLEGEKAGEFQRGYEAGWKAALERLHETSSTSAQGYPQAASGVERG